MKWKIKKNNIKEDCQTDDYCCKNVSDSIKWSCHYFAQTLPPSLLQWDWLAGRESASCFLPAGSEHKMNSELHMPCERGHGPLARSLARRTHNGCRSRSSQIKSTRIWFDLFFLFFVSESDVTLIIYLTIKPVWAFLVRLFSWRETSLVNIQGKNANARRRFWWRHVIGNSSRLTPTILWHNIEDLKSIASTKTDGIICRWACCHNSREEFFCSFFYSLILFASWGNWCLVYPKTNYYKKKNCHCMVVHLHTICRDLFTQCSEFLVFFVGGWGGDSSSSSVGKGRTSSLSRFQIRRSFLTRSSWLWNGETFFFFLVFVIGEIPYDFGFMRRIGSNGHLRQQSQ